MDNDNNDLDEESEENKEDEESYDSEEPQSAADVIFKCPFCHKEVYYDGGCEHFVFSYETVNFEYLVVKEEFAKRALDILRKKGYHLENLPCPLEDGDYDDNDQEMPALDKLIPGLSIESYQYDGPHGHGSWGVVVGLKQKDS